MQRSSDTDLLNKAVLRAGPGGQTRRAGDAASARPPRCRAAGDRADPGTVRRLRSKLLRSARSRSSPRSAPCSSSTRRRREFTDAQDYEAPA